MGFRMRKKSGIIRDSYHGVKTSRARVYVDYPDVGVGCLVDDINRVVVSITGWPFKYKITPYEEVKP